MTGNGSRDAPLIPFLSFDFHALLRETITRHFDDVRVPVSASFLRPRQSRSVPLACIRVREHHAQIRLHEIINRADVPLPVLRFILCHELLHVVIRPREIDGRRVMHPPEFWEAEARRFPECSQACDWIEDALCPWLIIDSRRENAALIRRSWRDSSRHRFPTLEEAKSEIRAWNFESL
jgi:hypothetical protein